MCRVHLREPAMSQSSEQLGRAGAWESVGKRQRGRSRGHGRPDHKGLGYQPQWSVVLSECTGQGKNWGQEWHRPIAGVKVPYGCCVEPDLQQDHLMVETVTVKARSRCLLWTQGDRYVIYRIGDYTDALELEPIKWQCQSSKPIENVQEGKLLKSLRVKKTDNETKKKGRSS